MSSRLLRLRASEINLLRRALQFSSKALLAQKVATSDERIKQELQDQIDSQDRLSNYLLKGDNK